VLPRDDSAGSSKFAGLAVPAAWRPWW